MIGEGWKHQPAMSHVVYFGNGPNVYWLGAWNRVFLGMFTCPTMAYLLGCKGHQNIKLMNMIWWSLWYESQGKVERCFLRAGRFTIGWMVIASCWGDLTWKQGTNRQIFQEPWNLALFSIGSSLCLMFFQKNVIKCRCAMVFLKRIHPSTWPDGHWSSPAPCNV